MQKGKVSEITYKRSVLKNITVKNEGIRPGVEAAGMELEGVTVVMSSNCILEWFKGCEDFYLQKTVNGIYEKGGRPLKVQLEINIPEDFEEKVLGKAIKEFNIAAEKRNLNICQCRVYAGKVSSMIAHVTVIGTTAYSMNCKNVRPGMDIVMTGSIAIGGTAVISELYKQKLSEKFAFSFVSDCLKLKEYISIEKEAQTAAECEAAIMHSVSGGGVFGAIWELASATDLGVTVSIPDILVWQEVIEVSEVFDVNPYLLDGTGSLLIVAEDGEKIAGILADNGINAKVIGEMTDSKDRIAVNGDETRYLEPPRGEELLNLIF